MDSNQICGAPVDMNGAPVPCANYLPCELHPYQKKDPQTMRTFVVFRTNAKDIKDDIEKHNYLDHDQPQFEGVQFSDGKVVQRWLTPSRSTVIWDSWEDLCTVHIYAHPDYGTRVEWGDGEVMHL